MIGDYLSHIELDAVDDVHPEAQPQAEVLDAMALAGHQAVGLFFEHTASGWTRTEFDPFELRRQALSIRTFLDIPVDATKH